MVLDQMILQWYPDIANILMKEILKLHGLPIYWTIPFQMVSICMIAGTLLSVVDAFDPGDNELVDWWLC